MRHEAMTCPQLDRHGNDLAYIIYTSGTTGNPRGSNLRCKVYRIWLRPIARFFSWVPEVACCSSPPFCSTRQFRKSSPVCTVERQSTCHQPIVFPSVRICYAQSVNWKSTRCCFHRPRWLYCQGWSYRSCRRWWLAESHVRSGSSIAGANGRRFINAYGPTEGTVTATVRECLAGEPGNPPIGQARKYARVYLLDAMRQPVEAGQTGEMYIGGSGVARGYRNDPQLTAKKFVTDPAGSGGPVVPHR